MALTDEPKPISKIEYEYDERGTDARNVYMITRKPVAADDSEIAAQKEDEYKLMKEKKVISVKEEIIDDEKDEEERMNEEIWKNFFKSIKDAEGVTKVTKKRGPIEFEILEERLKKKTAEIANADDASMLVNREIDRANTLMTY